MDVVYTIESQKGRVLAVCDNDEDIVKFLLLHSKYFMFPTYDNLAQPVPENTVEAWLKFLDGRDAEDLTTYMKRGTINHWGVNADYFSISPVGTENMGRDISMIYEELKK